MSTAKFDNWQALDGREFAGIHTWANFDGTGTPSLRDSLNVSSIIDNGPGDFTLNFTTALDNIDYAAAVAATDSTFGAATSLGGSNCLVATTSSLRLVFFRSNTASADVDRAHVHITGGLN